MSISYIALSNAISNLCDNILLTEEQKKEIVNFVIRYKQSSDLDSAFTYEPLLNKVEQFCKKWS